MKNYKLDKVTVYTPTYNRDYCLGQLYESLCRQTQNPENFEWLIVDDGSTDNTEEMVQKWINEASFNISYYKQKNEGKMAKLNFAHKIIETELCVCIDSDDFLLDDTIEIILNKWKEVRDDNSIAGVVGEAIDKHNETIGTKFPKEINRVKFVDFDKLKIKGDKIFVYRTNIISNCPPYPSLKGERFPAPGYLYRLIDVDYDLSVIHRPISVKDYLEDGLSKNKYSQFKKAPNSFCFYRQERMRLANSYSEKFRNAIHYVSSCMFAKKNIFKNNTFPFTTFLALPLGVLLNVYIKKTNKKGVL